MHLSKIYGLNIIPHQALYIQVHVTRLAAYPHHLGGHTMVGQSWRVLLTCQMSGHQTTENKQELC